MIPKRAGPLDLALTIAKAAFFACARGGAERARALRQSGFYSSSSQKRVEYQVVEAVAIGDGG
jgi:hypothetical protein